MLATGTVSALTPPEVFEKASPSVWAVRAVDAQERPIGYGSAVVIGPGQLVTRCRVLAKAKAIRLRRENLLFEANLQHADLERDLCILSASSLDSPAAVVGRMADLKVGQRVYAIGNPERLSLTLSEGMLSGLRDEDGKPLLQTTTPLSPGLSGGGLFDERGRLLGITGYGASGSGPSFAVPAEWISEVPERSRQMLARRDERGAAASSGAMGLPPVGSSWRYSFRDRQYSTTPLVFIIRLAGTERREVRESFSLEDGARSEASVDATSVRFSARRLPGDYTLVELAPYFSSTDLGKTAVPQRPAGYPGTGTWTLGSAQLQPEDVIVPAGTFRATRLDVRGTQVGHGVRGTDASANHLPARFHFTAWYAPEVSRYVMARHQTWNARDSLIADEVVQLLEHRRP